MSINWSELFALDTPFIEIFLRGTLIYLGLFVLLRFVLKREAGEVGISDLLMIVLLADAAQNAMADDYKSIPSGFLLVGTIVFWNFALDWLGYRISLIHKFVHPKPLLMVKNGRLVRGNLAKELLTKEELLGLLREQGIEDLGQVKEARMESDGRISAIQFEPKEQQGNPDRPSV